MSEQTTLPYLAIGDRIVVDGVVYEINREPGATTPHLDPVGDIREPTWDDAVYQDQVVPR